MSPQVPDTEDLPSLPLPAGPPQLTADQFVRLTRYGVPVQVQAQDVLFRPGDQTHDLIAIESGQVEILSPATRIEPEVVVARYEEGAFLGELNMLTGQTVYLTARIAKAGRIHRISPAQFRQVMSEDPEIADALIRTFLLRRDLLRSGAAARSIEVLGSGFSADALALRTYAARQRLPHLWLEVDGAAGLARLRAAELGVGDLPAVITPDRVIKRATPALLAEALGLAFRPAGPAVADLVVIGSGPAGLAAAVAGASEGLSTVLLDAVAVGGQAAASSRIENYLGFPSGLSGAELTQRAALQAMKFGARLSSPCAVAGLDTVGEHLRLTLADGTAMESRSVLIATGARYRKLPVDRWDEFEGAGIYYAATELEARACEGNPVTVVGGANSAGQAALYLASRGSEVTLAVRGPTLAQGMSAYLSDRLEAHAQVTVRISTTVVGLGGGKTLQSVTLRDLTGRGPVEKPCRGLFCLIGADPATAWRHGVALDVDGFIRTDVALSEQDLGATWAALGRSPLPFETSAPSVFAAGDVRSRSMKRVASAAGEGASAVHSVHAALGAPV